VLDAACGTGRGTVGLAEAVGPRGSVDALDISEAMLGLAQDKIEKLGLGDRVAFRQFWRKNPAYDAGVRPGRSGASARFPALPLVCATFSPFVFSFERWTAALSWG